MTPTIHSPLALLFAKIKAEMVANGTPFADSPAETAFRTWLQSAWLDSGCTQDFAVLYQPATSTLLELNLVYGRNGAKLNIWWGDGTSDNYALSETVNPHPVKFYAVGTLRPVVMLGRITRIDVAGLTAGGRLFTNLAPLHSLYCQASPLVRGDISVLSSCLKYFNTVGSDFTYSGGVWADGLRYISVNPTAAGIFTSAMTDAIIIDTSLVEWTGEKILDLTGNCGAPTAAADDAIDSHISQGVTVNTN